MGDNTIKIKEREIESTKWENRSAGKGNKEKI